MVRGERASIIYASICKPKINNVQVNIFTTNWSKLIIRISVCISANQCDNKNAILCWIWFYIFQLLHISSKYIPGQSKWTLPKKYIKRVAFDTNYTQEYINLKISEDCRSINYSLVKLIEQTKPCCRASSSIPGSEACF